LAATNNSVSFPFDVEIAGNYAYVADYTSLTVLDISDPANPTYTGSTGPMLYVTGLAISGNYAFALDNELGEYSVRVVDISDPTNPAVVMERSPEQMCRHMCISGNYAYMCYERAGHYFDVCTSTSGRSRTRSLTAPTVAAGLLPKRDTVSRSRATMPIWPTAVTEFR
jgi:hypothetical protein